MSSVLLLPVGSEGHFNSSVGSPIDPERLDAWLSPTEAAAIRARITNQLAVWGLQDNTRNLPGSGVQPIIWDRIDIGTLALFSNETEYFSRAKVIGKGISEAASIALWSHPTWRWLILLTDVQDAAIPFSVVIEGSGFSHSYKLNRQALVPKAGARRRSWPL
jgi:hypothetical protein